MGKLKKIISNFFASKSVDFLKPYQHIDQYGNKITFKLRMTEKGYASPFDKCSFVRDEAKLNEFLKSIDAAHLLTHRHISASNCIYVGGYLNFNQDAPNKRVSDTAEKHAV